RLEPKDGSSFVSALTQLAAAVGGDRVTFGIGRSQTAWVDGNPISLLPGQAMSLPAGQLGEISANAFQIKWNTGETLNVTNYGQYLGFGIALGGNGSSTSVGLMGSPDGNPANDFQLPDGTILAQPLSDTQFYGAYANAWRVTQANSLLDYASGQTTATFTNTNF